LIPGSPKRGRPPAAERRRALAKVRLYLHEKAQFEEQADRAGLTLSEYLRRCASGKKITSKVNLKAIAELNRLGGLQKQCMAHCPELQAEAKAVLHEIIEAIRWLKDGPEA